MSKLDEIILKPAHWQLDDYKEARRELKNLFLELISDCEDYTHTDKKTCIDTTEIRQKVEEL